MPLQSPEIHDLVPGITSEDILVSLGVEPGKPVRRRLARLVDEVLHIAQQVARPRMIWRIGNSMDVQTAFPPSRRLTRYLLKPEFTPVILE